MVRVAVHHLGQRQGAGVAVGRRRLVRRRRRGEIVIDVRGRRCRRDGSDAHTVILLDLAAFRNATASGRGYVLDQSFALEISQHQLHVAPGKQYAAIIPLDAVTGGEFFFG